MAHGILATSRCQATAPEPHRESPCSFLAHARESYDRGLPHYVEQAWRDELYAKHRRPAAPV
jgi:hypothetical protein